MHFSTYTQGWSSCRLMNVRFLYLAYYISNETQTISSSNKAHQENDSSEYVRFTPEMAITSRSTRMIFVLIFHSSAVFNRNPRTSHDSRQVWRVSDFKLLVPSYLPQIEYKSCDNENTVCLWEISCWKNRCARQPHWDIYGTQKCYLVFQCVCEQSKTLGIFCCLHGYLNSSH